MQLPRRSLDTEHAKKCPCEGCVQRHVMFSYQTEGLQNGIANLNEAVFVHLLPAVPESLGNASLEGSGVQAVRSIRACIVDELPSPRKVGVNDGDGQGTQCLNRLPGQRDGQAGIQNDHLERTAHCAKDRFPKASRQERRKLLPPATSGRLLLAVELHHDIPRVQISMDEVIPEDHSHVGRQALPGDPNAQCLWDAKLALNAFRVGGEVRGDLRGCRPGRARA
mmetsp:Transcript_45460/g.82220  ORF Transcript_45460/g.82220 Transcript_45460/m.82220 type:complete len:223 (+) Transcript_45460:229-897(+)